MQVAGSRVKSNSGPGQGWLEEAPVPIRLPGLALVVMPQTFLIQHSRDLWGTLGALFT